MSPRTWSVTLLLGVLACTTAAAQTPPPMCRPLQITGGGLVPAAAGMGGSLTLADGQPNWLGESFPYTVPTGVYLAITDVVFESKYVAYNGNLRSSYLVLWHLVSVPEHVGALHFRTPLVVPWTIGQIQVTFLNNSPEAQNMHAIVTGWLTDDPTLEACRGRSP